MTTRRLLSSLVLVSMAGLGACDALTGLGGADAPTNLTYQLLPSGNPDAPLGVLLTWSPPRNGAALTYDVYGRSSMGDDWSRRATTTSTSFHDAGVPQLQYYVVALDRDDNEMGRSPSVTIDLSDRLPAPAGLTSISLDRGVQLAWSDNAYQAGRTRFAYYRVYSSAYDAASGRCSVPWSLEGTTVANSFLAAQLTNGTSRCFAVSALSTDGHESAWSEARLDTPRFDARNVLVSAADAEPARAGFLFFDEVAHDYGVVAATSRADLDFVVDRHADGSLWIRPARSDVKLALYATTRVADLTSIDRAPTGASLGAAALEAVPGYAYVFSTRKSDGLHYAGVRVDFVSRDYVVFDWSYQSAAGNPELVRAAP